MGTSFWTLNLDRGLGSLARHKPVDAVRFLQKALAECPASRARELYRICFFLGIALQKLGYSQSAIKSWISCQRLNKRGYTRKMLSRLTNGYGMERQINEERDDWKAFSSIQVARYLLAKNKRTFSTPAEQDMIFDLIRDHWKTLLESGALRNLSNCDKVELFRQTWIVFPTAVITEPHVNGPVIAVNFQTRKKIRLEDRCPCSSGLPFILCCGRTVGEEELLSGLF